MTELPETKFGGSGANVRVAGDEQDPNIVRFSYPPTVKGQVAFLAPQVILELGTHAEFTHAETSQFGPSPPWSFPSFSSRPTYP